MAGGIFVSYRRDDAKHAAGRLVDRLVTAVDRDKLFMDVDNIEPGLDFVQVLSEQVAKCDVLLALIGPNWLDARDKNGARRLDDARDFVRIEIEAALARNIRVVPVLLDGAKMPPVEALPPSLHPLTRRQAVRISHERFAAEAEGLAGAMKKALGLPGDSTPMEAPRPGFISSPVKSAPSPAGSPHTSSIVPASIFAIAAVPLTLLGSALLAQSLGGQKTETVLLGAAVLSTVFGLIAAFKIRRDGDAATANKATLYWFGAVSSLGFTMGILFESLEVNLAGGFYGRVITGWIVGAIFAIMSTIAFRRRWKARHPGHG